MRIPSDAIGASRVMDCAASTLQCSPFNVRRVLVASVVRRRPITVIGTVTSGHQRRSASPFEGHSFPQ